MGLESQHANGGTIMSSQSVSNAENSQTGTDRNSGYIKLRLHVLWVSRSGLHAFVASCVRCLARLSGGPIGHGQSANFMTSTHTATPTRTSSGRYLRNKAWW